MIKIIIITKKEEERTMDSREDDGIYVLIYNSYTD